MKNYLVFLLTALISSYGSASQVWTDEAKVSFVRTYDGTTYSIGLTGIDCPNTKNYFYVHDRPDNAPFFTIALSSLMSSKKVRISYTLDPGGVHCYVAGIQINE